MLHLKILTPRKIVFDEKVSSVSAPSSEGEISILPRHTKLLTVLQEGVVTIRKGNKEDFLAIGGGYLETDGKELHILVSRAYGQDEIDEQLTQKALEEAKRLVKEVKEESARHEAMATMRRSVIDLKLLRMRRASKL